MDPLILRARLRLFPPEEGGRGRPIRNDYRPSWNLGNTWLGKPTINDGRVLLDEGIELPPGAAVEARIQPLVPELWGRIRAGSVIPCQEGGHVVGYATILEIVSRPELFDPEVCTFVDQAHQFCAFVEKLGEYSLQERVRGARRRLIELYAAGSELPLLEPPEGHEAGPNPETPKAWVGFEDFDPYWQVFDPYEEDAPVGGSLTDDILDVYSDVRRGLDLWAKPAARAAAIWEWRFHFDVHWGDHAVDALRALHRACSRSTGTRAP